MKLIDNASGNVSQGITLTSDNKADKYKISWDCSSIGSGKSYIRIYATLEDASYKTYFIPIQFLGMAEFEFNIDTSSIFLQFDLIGDATVTAINFETVTDATMEYVKKESKYWDRIKEITNNTGKLKAEAMEGIINLTLNAFANESGTITQENGVMTFLNGNSITDSDMAVQITGGAIRISNRKNADGSWAWSTAINGSGINADMITTGILRAIELSGVNITTSTMTAGNIVGASMTGGKADFGDKENGTYMEVTQAGDIYGYVNDKKSVHLAKSSEGRLILGKDIDGSGYSLNLNSHAGLFGTSNTNPAEGSSISAYNNEGLELSGGGVHIVLHAGGVQIYTQNRSGVVYVEGDIDCSGSIRAAGGVY